MAVSHDSTGEVCVVRGCAKYTEERPPCNSPNGRFVRDLLGVADLEILDSDKHQRKWHV